MSKLSKENFEHLNNKQVRDEVIDFIYKFDHVDEESKFQVAELLFDVPEAIIKIWCLENARHVLRKSLHTVQKTKESLLHGNSPTKSDLQRLKNINNLLKNLKKLNGLS